MNRSITIIAFLALANVATAFGVIHYKHKSRMLYQKTRALQALIDQSNVDWGRLQIEESTLARFGRIEELAATRLDMRMPEHSEIKTVTK